MPAGPPDAPGGPAGFEVAADWPLWGGTARLVVRGVDPASARSALVVARAQVDAVVAAVDAACSRFRPDSEVSRLEHAGGSAVEVSELLAEAVEAALRGARLTDGAVDPTIGTAMVAAGYDRDLSQLPPPPASDDPAEATDEPLAPLPRVRRTATWRDVLVDPAAHLVQVPDGVLLDLGATAKAFAADRAAHLAHQAVGAPVLVSLCGDIAVAGTEVGRPWLVLVVERPDETRGPLVEIYDGGLATSTTRARRWSRSGRAMHHLLDPVTGLPAPEVWRTVTVAAASCLDANIASTATVVKGQGGLSWLRGTGLPARVVASDGTVTGVGGWPADALAVPS